MKYVRVSSIEEALEEARQALKQKEDFVLFEGDGTMVGVMYAVQGGLLLYLSKRGTWFSTTPIEDELSYALRESGHE